MNFRGVMPAITTPFTNDDEVDFEFVAKHVTWLVDHGCTGIVPLGSLGEGATLEFEEKRDLLAACVDAIGERVPVMAAVSALSTRMACHIARTAKDVGCSALMVLPPYVHKGPMHEIHDHFAAVIEATDLPCMIYNNPIAYGTDLTPPELEQFAERFENVQAVKESSGDLRRITAIRALCGERLALFAGLDDMIVEGVAAGAVGWIAGLVNAMPRESVELFDRAIAGDDRRAFELYRWFLPLLRLDTVPEFVQLIKLVQSECDMGSERCRPPRSAAVGAQRDGALMVIRNALATRPRLD
ncbi:MAG: dihydrodipicolinate synthase family protein [Planctomycetes bacterium]|nr:dihydrodipicolinate synthase family protein [Planctomycetota bacterium]MCB9891079.1 dihydrodipicolinate synthase family protein [Planctomycetota bacterium]MCB9916960.1 dihydrodipicolinate synthase family protein [Planctomycetota bacterium]